MKRVTTLNGAPYLSGFQQIEQLSTVAAPSNISMLFKSVDRMHGIFSAPHGRKVTINKLLQHIRIRWDIIAVMPLGQHRLNPLRVALSEM